MTSALVGHTGFVGSNLLRQRSFDACFNSSTISDMRGRRFDLVVFSGARAEKWKANAEPERDREHIDSLIDVLRTVEAKRFVLISTVDVFKSPIEVDEESPTPMEDLHAYGRNRRRLEQFAASAFDTCVVRLAGLYGHGIKKNIIYDFLNDNDVHKIDSRGVFQFYGLDRLWRDITTALDARLPLVHLPCEPVSVAEVARAAFGVEFRNEVVPAPARYDIRTRHATLFGGEGWYVENKARELAGIAGFVTRERAAKA
jgi:nucleoside-diphosphate-sugar epimerase